MPRDERAYLSVVIEGCDAITVAALGLDLHANLPNRLHPQIMEGDFRTWQLPDGAILRLGKGALGDFDTAVALSQDGRVLAVAGAIGVWLYEVATSRVIALFSSRNKVNSVAFSPDGRTLASGSYNGTIELWEVRTGTRIATLKGPTWIRINSLAFSPDGTLLASGSVDKTVKLWNLATRIDFATLASLSWDGTVLLWDMRRFLPWPHELEKIADDEQEAWIGSQVAQPFVVLVRDQYGAPLARADQVFCHFRKWDFDFGEHGDRLVRLGIEQFDGWKGTGHDQRRGDRRRNGTV